MRALVAVAVAVGLCQGCVMPRASKAMLVANLAIMACDWSQTRSWAELGWKSPERERNPILGPTPTPVAVDVYFLAAAAVTVGLWHLVPERYRLAASVGLGALQVRNVRINAHAIENHADGRNVCGQ